MADCQCGCDTVDPVSIADLLTAVNSTGSIGGGVGQSLCWVGRLAVPSGNTEGRSRKVENF